MKILVVDNNKSFLQKVRKLFDAMREKISLIKEISPESAKIVEDVELHTCHDFSDFFYQDLNSIDLVVADLYMPPTDVREPRPVRHELWDGYYTPEGEPPIGLLTVLECVHKDVKCILLTDGNHHGSKHSWLYDGYLYYKKRQEEEPPFEYLECSKDDHWSHVASFVVSHILDVHGEAWGDMMDILKELMQD